MNEDILLPHLRLKLNLEHLNYESCYCDGYIAASEEHDVDDCPFEENSQQHKYWLEGWWAGFYGEAPLFDLELERHVETITQEAESTQVDVEGAANDPFFTGVSFSQVARIAGALAATALIGYQVLELIA